MTLSRLSRAVLATAVVLVLVVIYAPLAVVVISSFSSSKTFGWPPPSYTLHWWGDAWSSGGALHAVGVSVQVGLLAMGVALFLGTLLAFGLSRYRFFGRNSLSLLVILPIALPGIVTGMALKNAFEVMLGIQLGYFTLVVAHATFCVVVVFNNGGVYKGDDINTVSTDPAPTALMVGARHDKLIEAFGGTGYRASTPAELTAALSQALASGAPALIDCVIDPTAGTESGHLTNLNPKGIGHA